ncbi:MAG: PAS domain S-box protein [Anaerolineae bacterium]
MHVSDQAFEYLSRLQRVSVALARAITPAQVIDTIITDGIAAVGTVMGFVGLLTPDGGTLRVVAYAGYPDTLIQQWANMPLSQDVPATRAVRERAPQWIRSDQEYADLYPHLATARLGSFHGWAVLPLIVEESVLGVIGLSFTEPQPFTEDVQRFLKAIAGQCAIALHRAQLLDDARQTAALLDQTYDAVFTWAEDLGIRDWYNGATRVYGWTETEAVGKNAQMLLHTIAPRPMREIYAHIVKTGYWEGELIHRTKDGRQITLESRMSRALQKDGQVVILEVNRDVTDRRIVEEAIHRQAEEFRSLYNLLPIGYFSLDGRGRFTHINDTALRMLGYAREEVVGLMESSRIYTETSREQLADHELMLREQGYISNLEIELITCDGQMIPVLLNAIAVKDVRGGIMATHNVVLDLTERKRSEMQALQMAMEQERSKLLAEFVRTAMHDFATPMSVINTSLYLLSKSPDADSRPRHIDMIHQQMAHLTRLMEVTMLMARLQSGVSLVPVRLNWGELVRRVVHDGQSLAVGRGVTLSLVLEPDLPIVCGDESYLYRALHEIVRNAIFFTPRGGSVQVTVSYSGDDVITVVEDTGMGIHPDQLPHLFERFFRADAARSTETGGAGLGLTIAKAILDAHGGTIAVESTVDVGSRFRVVLTACE